MMGEEDLKDSVDAGIPDVVLRQNNVDLGKSDSSI